MASKGPKPKASKSNGPNPNISTLKDALYEQAAAKHLDKMIDQETLIALGVIPNGDLKLLADCVNALLNERLFKVHTQPGSGKYVYRVLSKELGSKQKNLSTDESLIYTCIEAAGTQGIWRRAIQTRTNLHTSIVTRTLKSLEGKRLIKSVVNVKQPTQRIYMLDELALSDELTGGPWYTTGGELDTDFIQIVADAAHRFVVEKSFERREGRGRKRRRGDAGILVGSDEEEDVKGEMELLPMPPGYRGYPTALEVKRFINGSELMNDVTLDDHAVETMMDVLCWDGKVEKVLDGVAYKAVRNRIDDEALEADNRFAGTPYGQQQEGDDPDEDDGFTHKSNWERLRAWQ